MGRQRFCWWKLGSFPEQQLVVEPNYWGSRVLLIEILHNLGHMSSML